MVTPERVVSSAAVQSPCHGLEGRNLANFKAEPTRPDRTAVTVTVTVTWLEDRLAPAPCGDAGRLAALTIALTIADLVFSAHEKIWQS